jgi:alpha-L-rhamnosidase
MKKYATLAQSTKEAFNKEYLEEDYYSYNSKISDTFLHFDLCSPKDRKGYRKRFLYTQTPNVLPLYLDMVPENKKSAVLENLFENVEVTHDCHVSTGILGTRYILDTLTKCGRADLAYRLATQTTYPSWGYMIKEGATTLWERWEYMAGGGMNSHNHIMFGSIDAWFYRVLAGINHDLFSPGFRRVIIKPYIQEDLNYVSASVKTIRGLVSSSWRKEQNTLVVEVILPVNSEGEVNLPLLGLKDPVIKESGREIFKNSSYLRGITGIIPGKRDDGYVTFNVGSGAYSFWIGESS